jgi:hypothetical protein
MLNQVEEGAQTSLCLRVSDNEVREKAKSQLHGLRNKFIGWIHSWDCIHERYSDVLK